MNAARQRLRRFGRPTGARTRPAADYCITATISIKSDPLNSLTIADLYKKHESFPPNARIAHAMYQVKYIEALGTGLTDLLRNCREAGLKKPVLEEVSGRFRIVIWRKENGNKLEITKAKLLELVKKSGEFSLIEYANACECDNKTIKRSIESLKKIRGCSSRWF